MTFLVTSATGAGYGYGKILAFAPDGKPSGAFGNDPRIVDPRGLGIERIDGCSSSTAAPIELRPLGTTNVAADHC
jgi:hypothetical protein